MKWRHLGLAVLVLVVAAVTSWPALYLPQLEDQRRGVVEGLLERVIGRSVVVSGPIDIQPGLATTVTIADASLGEGGPDDWQGTLTLRRLSLTFDVLRALVGPFQVRRARGRWPRDRGVRRHPRHGRQPLAPEPDHQPWPGDERRRTGEIALTDLSFERRNDPDG
ncbi:MAG: hypothetical protein R3D28_24760 [Geminicoccaceae bacterium]